MDGTTEPIIAVIGHPIAGNPTQFAIERAFRALNMDWRVLSFDIRPEDIAAALDGFSVTGIAGVMIDSSVREEASLWYASKSEQASTEDTTSDLNETWDESELQEEDANPNEIAASKERLVIDCLFRDEEKNFVGGFAEREWVDERIEQHAGENRVWLGQTLEGLPISRNGFAESIPMPPDPNVVENANVILIASEAALLEAEEWPEDDGATLVIDLTGGHDQQSVVQQLGYRVVTELDRHVGMLQRCLQRWTGETTSAEVIHDAIEEYLGV